MVMHVDALNGADTVQRGDIEHPFRTLSAALARRTTLPSTTPVTIVLHGGVHLLPATLHLAAAHSNTHITGAPGEPTTVSGAVALPDLQWQPYRINTSTCVGGLCTTPGTNDIFDMAPSATTLNVTRTDNATLCAKLCMQDPACLSYTWHDATYSVDYNRTCWFRLDRHYWSPTAEQHHVSG